MHSKHSPIEIILVGSIVLSIILIIFVLHNARMQALDQKNKAEKTQIIKKKI